MSAFQAALHYQPSRSLSNLQDVYEEFQTLAVAFAGKITFRGVFTEEGERQMDPAPRVGDFWLAERLEDEDLVHYARLQVGIQPTRRRASFPVIMESA